MSAKERIGKLEALLERIHTNAAAPRTASMGGAMQTVPPSAAAREALRSESNEFDAVAPPEPPPPPPPPAPSPVAPEPLESRARLVAAQPAEAEDDEVLELDDRHIVADEDIQSVDGSVPPPPPTPVAAPADEPPPSSRRPIAEPAESPQEAELQVAPSPPLTPPPESGKQVAAEALTFDDDFTGVRESGARLQPAPPAAEPSIALASLREPAPPAPPDDLEAEIPARGDETRPPPGPLPPMVRNDQPAANATPTSAPMPEVTRPTTPVAASQVASLVGSAATFSPHTFGELLDATLAL